MLTGNAYRLIKKGLFSDGAQKESIPFTLPGFLTPFSLEEAQLSPRDVQPVETEFFTLICSSFSNQCDTNNASLRAVSSVVAPS
jgi:hypothetical protein